MKIAILGAGVLADRLIVDQTDEQFDRVFNTKIEGLRSLLANLSDDPLQVICMFSSVSARCGNNGQSTYAMANEILNKVAWAGTEETWPAAYELLSAYELRNEDQITMMKAIDQDGQDLDGVVAGWVDDNQSVWQPWVDAATQ